MKVLLINKYSYLKGGAERYVKELGELLVKHRISVSFFSTKPKLGFSTLFRKSMGRKGELGKRIFLTDLLDFEYLPVLQKVINVLKVFYNNKANSLLAKAISQNNFDIVHINNVYYQLPTLLINTLYRKKIPIVMTVHDFKLVHFNYNLFNFITNRICLDALSGKFLKCFFHNCTNDSFFDRLIKVMEAYFCNLNGVYSKISLFIAPSLYIKDILVKAGYDERKIFVLPNPISISKYKITYSQGEFFTYFGRISKEKGIDMLVGVADNLPNERFYIVGAGPYKKELELVIARKKLKNVILKNWLRDSELKKVLGRSKAVLIPSLWPENCPYAALEALAMGKPVIASRIGGITEIIKDSYNGYTFQTGSVNDLINKVKKLANQSKSEYLAMSKNARETVKANFSPEKYFKKLMAIYNYATKSIG